MEPLAYNIIASDEGQTTPFRLDANGGFSSPPLETEAYYVTTVHVVSFVPEGGFKVEPVPFNGQPQGLLPAGTTAATISLSTEENATCRYALVPGVAYASMPNTFATTGSTTHAEGVSGLNSGGSYSYYVRCSDSAGKVNTADYVIAFSVSHPPPPPSPTPVAAYGFDEGTGSVLVDLSGNSNNGIVSGAAWTSQGRFGGALSFDGVNDWVTVAHDPTLNAVTGLTLEAWVHPASNGQGVWRNVVIKERAGGEVFNLYANVDTDTPAVYVVGASQPGSAIDTRGISQLPSNTWSHLAATYDGAVLRVYVNGNQTGSRTVSGELLTSTGALRVGGNSLWGEYFQGRIDEIRIYNRALSQAEIAADMNTPVNDPASDVTPPVRFDGQPVGVLAWGTVQATLSLGTNENATCRYATQPGMAFSAMPNTFNTTGSSSHATPVSGLTNGGSYNFYVRCVDSVNNANTGDFVIAFSVSASSAVTSSFGGTESPLFEAGMWDSPGAWANLSKNNGAYTGGLNAQGRLVTPLVGADQYAEMTYDQDPGGGSWVGVTTRVQGAGNGSGYLAIVYAGEVRLYRTDDTGGLTFTQLASASAAIGTAPRRLRLESEGNTHRVYFNGTLLITHAATGTVYTQGQPGIAASVFGGPQVKIVSFEGGKLDTAGGGPPEDTVPPARSNGQPAGALAWGTTQTTLGVTTDEAASCRYSLTPGLAYAAMPSTFASTGGTSHTTPLSGLSNGTSYSVYVRCLDTSANANPDDFVIAFAVAASSGTTSSFSGSESPLSEGGMWDSPGAWANLVKNNGAYAEGLNALGRLVTPVGADQYAEVTYDQDPGAASWVGVTTRVQSGADGSGYLAIVYAGEVRLYRTDGTGGLTFTQLASASAAIGTAPRRLRLESEGNTHRVYFNGALVITHNATGTLYTQGQPGVAASVFGGPQVKILSFEGGNLGGD
jgi:hypothetical protein